MSPILGIVASSKSTPGLILTPRTLPVTFNLNGFAKGGSSSLWMVGSSGSTAAATSSDGITWTTVTTSIALKDSLAGNPGSSYFSGNNTGTGARSNDGTSWASVTMQWSGNTGFVKYFSNISAYIRKMYGAAMEYGSTNAATWTDPSQTNYTALDAASNGTTIIWPTYGNQYIEWTSTSQWTTVNGFVSLPATKNWCGAAYDSVNNKFVVYDDTTSLAYSTSGTGSWTSATRPAQTGVGYQMSNDGGGGAYVLGGYASYLYSTNATTWINVPLSGSSGNGYITARWDSTNSRFLLMNSATTNYWTGTKPP